MPLQSFLDKHLAALEQDQARHNLMLGILNEAQKDASKVRLWSLGDNTACAVQTIPRYIILGDLNSQQLDRLADQVKDLDFQGCMGSDGIAEDFAKSLLKFGIPLKLALPQRIYQLEERPLYPKCPGQGTKAAAADQDLFCDWFMRFMIEAVPHENPQTREMMAKTFQTRSVFFWFVEGKPVSMAARNRETKTGSNISFVFTPPEHRKKGYAGAITAFAADNAFQEGKKSCFLYTDLRNLISNSVYQKIGFKAWCDVSSFTRNKNFYQMRSANSADFAFVKKLYYETMREYIEPLWGWQNEQQDTVVKKIFQPEKIQILQQDNLDIGLLIVEQRPDDLFLASLSVIPSKQGQGFGAAATRATIDKARQSKQALRLQVLKTNPKARKLYERLGFVLEKESSHSYELLFT